MHHTQQRLLPERIYEPNIIHNPFTWMGIWTPHGWRVHRKRWGKAQRLTKHLSGDGRTTFFPQALLDPQSGRVEWQDDLHLKDDPFTDQGIYPSDPRVEYPPGQPRWAVSHTLLCHPVADHNLYTHQYTWDMVHGHLQTHFHRHVELEECRTDGRDGLTVQVKHRPISLSIEGNVRYPLANSAVRGVWDNPSRSGQNYYTRRIVQLIRMHNAVYGIAPQIPVVQCHGMYETFSEDPLEAAFDRHSGECIDPEAVQNRMQIPLDEPKIGLLDMHPYRQVPSQVYEGPITMLERHFGTVDDQHLRAARALLGARFTEGKVGYAFRNAPDSSDSGYAGYTTNYDVDADGVISQNDVERIERHRGRTVRFNLYNSAYFGGDWLTTSVCLTPEHDPGTRAVADYEYGGGYDSEAGLIHLLRTPGPDRPVWVEYFHDAPAEPGENNILIHLYREI